MRDLGRTSSALHFADARIDEGARLRPLDLQRFIGVSVSVRFCRLIQLFSARSRVALPLAQSLATGKGSCEERHQRTQTDTDGECRIERMTLVSAA